MYTYTTLPKFVGGFSGKNPTYTFRERYGGRRMLQEKVEKRSLFSFGRVQKQKPDFFRELKMPPAATGVRAPGWGFETRNSQNRGVDNHFHEV